MMIELVAALVAVTSSPAAKAGADIVFPAAMRGAWADTLADCEPEFTHGFTIERSTLVYHDGPSKLLSRGPTTKVRSPVGPGYTFVARMRHQEHGNPAVIATERFTVSGRWLYHSAASGSLRQHFAVKNRLVRCPPGSTSSR